MKSKPKESEPIYPAHSTEQYSVPNSPAVNAGSHVVISDSNRKIYLAMFILVLVGWVVVCPAGVWFIQTANHPEKQAVLLPSTPTATLTVNEIDQESLKETDAYIDMQSSPKTLTIAPESTKTLQNTETPTQEPTQRPSNTPQPLIQIVEVPVTQLVSETPAAASETPTPQPTITLQPTETQLPGFVILNNHNRDVKIRIENALLDLLEFVTSRWFLIFLTIAITGALIWRKTLLWLSAKPTIEQTEETFWKEPQHTPPMPSMPIPINSNRDQVSKLPPTPQMLEIMGLIVRGDMTRSAIAEQVFNSSGGSYLPKVDAVGFEMVRRGIIRKYPPPPYSPIGQNNATQA